DDTRYNYKAVGDPNRLRGARRIQYGTQIETSYSSAIEHADAELRRIHEENGDGSGFALLSPMMACEEAYLLGNYVRSIDPEAVLVLGPVPSSGQDEVFKNYLSVKVTFTIKGEKVPNAAGIRRVIKLLGGPTATLEELAANAKLKGGWIVGEYLSNWVTDSLKLPRGVKIVQDILPNKLTDSADV